MTTCPTCQRNTAVIVAQDRHIKALETALQNSARSLAANGRTLKKTRKELREVRGDV